MSVFVSQLRFRGGGERGEGPTLAFFGGGIAPSPWGLCTKKEEEREEKIDIPICFRKISKTLLKYYFIIIVSKDEAEDII